MKANIKFVDVIVANNLYFISQIKYRGLSLYVMYQ